MQVIKDAVNTGHGNAVLIAGIAGLVFSDIIPTPGDALYFWQQQRLKKKLNDHKITPKAYWIKEASGYYLYNSIWWALVGTAVLITKGDFHQKMKIGLGCIGAGVVIAVIVKNIHKDEETEFLK